MWLLRDRVAGVHLSPVGGIGVVLAGRHGPLSFLERCDQLCRTWIGTRSTAGKVSSSNLNAVPQTFSPLSGEEETTPHLAGQQRLRLEPEEVHLGRWSFGCLFLHLRHPMALPRRQLRPWRLGAEILPDLSRIDPVPSSWVQVRLVHSSLEFWEAQSLPEFYILILPRKTALPINAVMKIDAPRQPLATGQSL